MADTAAPIAHPEAGATAPALGIPLQTRRGSQPDLRRIAPTTASVTPSALDPVTRSRSVLIGSDTAVIIFAVLIASCLTVDADFRLGFGWASEGPPWLLSGIVIGLWLAALAGEGVWDALTHKPGSGEVRRILLAALMVFAGVGVFGYLTGSDLARPYLLIAAPVGVAGLLVNHWIWRRSN